MATPDYILISPLVIVSFLSSYMEYGFVNLQRIVEESIISFVTNATVDIDVAMRVRSDYMYIHI